MPKQNIDPRLQETGGLVPVSVGGEHATIVMMKPESVAKNLASASEKAVRPITVEKGQNVSKFEEKTIPPINK